jgi:endoribonuclease LACTB2
MPSLREVASKLHDGDYTPAPGGGRGPFCTHPSILPPGSDTRDWELQVLQCPGHTVDSISLVFPADRSLFTGDTVLGQGTAVFEDLGDYLASLQKMLDASDKYETINSGHGPVVPNGPQTIRMYIDHRLQREAQIVGLLRTTPA